MELLVYVLIIKLVFANLSLLDYRQKCPAKDPTHPRDITDPLSFTKLF